MVGIVRAIALGLLVVAIIVHIVGFASDNWVSLKFNINDVVAASHTRSTLYHQVDVEINMGLRKICVKPNVGQLLQNAMSQASQGMDGQYRSQDSHWQSSSVRDFIGGISICFNCLATKQEYTPDWMEVVRCAGWKKAVQGLGVVSLIVAVKGVAAILYSYFGDGKGDFARWMPFIIAAICGVAGVLLLIGTAVYWAEFGSAMRSLINMFNSKSSGLHHLAEIVKKTHFGYSFVLEAVAGVLMLLISAVVAIPAIKGWDISMQFSGPRNMAV